MAINTSFSYKNDYFSQRPSICIPGFFFSRFSYFFVYSYILTHFCNFRSTLPYKRHVSVAFNIFTHFLVMQLLK